MIYLRRGLSSRMVQLNKPLQTSSTPQYQHLSQPFPIFQRRLQLKQMLPRQELVQYLCKTLVLQHISIGLQDPNDNSYLCMRRSCLLSFLLSRSENIIFQGLIPLSRQIKKSKLVVKTEDLYSIPDVLSFQAYGF